MKHSSLLKKMKLILKQYENNQFGIVSKFTQFFWCTQKEKGLMNGNAVVVVVIVGVVGHLPIALICPTQSK